MSTTNIRKLNSKPRKINISLLSRDELDAILPFSSFCELWFYGKLGYENKVFSKTFVADISKEVWTDIATGACGCGTIEMAAYKFGIDADEAERRLRDWASIASPVEYEEGEVSWAMPGAEDFFTCTKC